MADRTKPKEEYDNLRGLIWGFWGVVSASAMNISVRGASFELNALALVFTRSLATMLILILLVAALPKYRKSLRFSKPRDHLIRGLMLTVAVNCGFYALSTIPLADAAILFGLAPIFASVIAVLFMRQRMGLRRSLAILVSFFGAVIIINPTAPDLELGYFIGAGSAVFWGLSLLMSRDLAHVDGTNSTMLSSVIITTVLTLPFAYSSVTVPSTGEVWAWVSVLIIAGLFRTYSDIKAYSNAEASVLTPMFFLRFIFIALGAYFFFAEIPSLRTWIGGTLIISATVFVTYREAQLKRVQKEA